MPARKGARRKNIARKRKQQHEQATQQQEQATQQQEPSPLPPGPPTPPPSPVVKPVEKPVERPPSPILTELVWDPTTFVPKPMPLRRATTLPTKPSSTPPFHDKTESVVAPLPEWAKKANKEKKEQREKEKQDEATRVPATAHTARSHRVGGFKVRTVFNDPRLCKPNPEDEPLYTREKHSPPPRPKRKKKTVGPKGEMECDFSADIPYPNVEEDDLWRVRVNDLVRSTLTRREIDDKLHAWANETGDVNEALERVDHVAKVMTWLDSRFFDREVKKPARKRQRSRRPARRSEPPAKRRRTGSDPLNVARPVSPRLTACLGLENNLDDAMNAATLRATRPEKAVVPASFSPVPSFTPPPVSFSPPPVYGQSTGQDSPVVISPMNVSTPGSFNGTPVYGRIERETELIRGSPLDSPYYDGPILTPPLTPPHAASPSHDANENPTGDDILQTLNDLLVEMGVPASDAE